MSDGVAISVKQPVAPRRPSVAVQHEVPAAPVVDPAAEAARAAAAEQRAESLRRQRQSMEESDAGQEEAAEEVSADAVEVVDSIELELPNGRIIEYGPTRGASKALVLGRIFSGQNMAQVMSRNVVETLLYIRSIDGAPVAPLTDLINAQKLLNIIDDDGLETLMVAHNTYWPPVTAERLRVVKKNLQRP